MTTSPPACWSVAALLIATLTHPASARPQALRVSSETTGQDSRWDKQITAPTYEERKLATIAESFRQSASLNRALLEVLEGLTEDELRVLERALPADELPQGDMADSPQDLQGSDTDTDTDQAVYRGELLLLDNVNTTGTSDLLTNASDSEPEPEPVYPQLQKINREKLKEMRLATIKNQIMNILWPVGTPPSFSGNTSTPPQPHQHDLLRAIADKMKNQKNSFTPGDVYTEKIQSFYPSCEVPWNTDAEMWNESGAMNLLFDLTYPSSAHGTQMNIVAAKLRLYKLSQGNTSNSSELCPPSESEDGPSEERGRLTSPGSEDKMIRVSVYWYTRSLKKRKVKRKLLDSQMLPVSGESWTEWNIRGAVKAWRDSGRNHGLAVQVEDEDGALQPADKYFTPMNCSQEASTSRPIPGFLVARALASASANGTNHTFRPALRFDTLLFPMIDLCTIEFPESENPDTIYYHKVSENTETTIRKKILKSNNKGGNVTETSNIHPKTFEGEKHKIRHQNHKQLEGSEGYSPPHRHTETVRRDDGDSIEEITWADDLDGHQLRKQIIMQKVIMKTQNNQQDQR